MFRGAPDALKFAFSTISKPILKISSVNSMRGAEGNGDLTPHDRHAQAAIIISLIERAVDTDGCAHIMAHYGAELRGGKNGPIVIKVLVKAVTPSLPKGLHNPHGIAKMVEVYFGARYTMISVRAELRCNNRRYYKYKERIYDALDRIGSRAEADAYQALDNAGLILHED